MSHARRVRRHSVISMNDDCWIMFDCGFGTEGMFLEAHVNVSSFKWIWGQMSFVFNGYLLTKTLPDSHWVSDGNVLLRERERERPSCRSVFYGPAPVGCGLALDSRGLEAEFDCFV